MKNVKNLVMIAALTATASLATAADFPVSEPKVTIPTPPAGERWILNDAYSDEFNTDKLDSNKWYDKYPGWAGRPPGMFLEENVSVGDGCLKVKGGSMDKPVIKGTGDKASIYDLSCGSIASVGADAHYGYYEARAKANKTALSTTFWLLSRGPKMPVKGNQPISSEYENYTYAQELDICETIGRGGSADEGWTEEAADFHKAMNSNIHCWLYSDEGTVDMVVPKIPGLRPEDGSVMSDGFNTYGCWWYDEDGAEFFLNNVSNGSREKFVATNGQQFKVKDPMALNVWVETYRWTPRPLDADLDDPTKNTSYFDWIRHYVLVDVDKKDTNPAPEQDQVFEDYVHFPEHKVSGAGFELIYIAPVDRSLMVEIYSGKKLVGSQTFDAYAGFGNSTYSVDGANLKSGENYTVVAYLVKEGAKKSNGYLSGDSFEFTAK